ncbi:hypothetical protein B0H16DRAFT_1470403 [Mycena metata]|uniref:Uncharacterized protein n=1 Tax=Mycena metata TaxID=1033252 RepID=A0AAD7HUN3_9AGAR|nr:hypothetical protein B0H16DRAFT_1470403 [Mycena metata]
MAAALKKTDTRVQRVASTSGSESHQPLLVPRAHHDEAARSETTLAQAPPPPDRPLPPPTWCAFDIRGDEKEEGPIFNYGQLFTWFAVTAHVENGFDAAIASFQRGAPVPKTTAEAARRCNWQESEDLSAFIAWSELPGAVIKHMWLAAIAAVIFRDPHPTVYGYGRKDYGPLRAVAGP